MSLSCLLLFSLPAPHVCLLVLFCATVHSLFSSVIYPLHFRWGQRFAFALRSDFPPLLPFAPLPLLLPHPSSLLCLSYLPAPNMITPFITYHLGTGGLCSWFYPMNEYFLLILIDVSSVIFPCLGLQWGRPMAGAWQLMSDSFRYTDHHPSSALSCKKGTIMRRREANAKAST